MVSAEVGAGACSTCSLTCHSRLDRLKVLREPLSRMSTRAGRGRTSPPPPLLLPEAWSTGPYLRPAILSQWSGQRVTQSCHPELYTGPRFMHVPPLHAMHQSLCTCVLCMYVMCIVHVFI